MDAWYYMMHDVQIGPITKADLAKLAANGIISAKTQVWSPEAPQWRCFEELNLGSVQTPRPPMTPPVAANPNPEAQSNGCFSLLGKAVVAVFILGLLGAIMGDRESSSSDSTPASSASTPDSVIAEATRIAFGEFKKMDRVVGGGRFSASMETEMCNFIVTSIAEILKIPNVDADVKQWLQRYSQAFAIHKKILETGAGMMMNAQGSNLERVVFSELEAAIKESDANKWRVIKEADAVFDRIKRRYPSTNFNNL
ncbi:MAG: DUF4339 domain-containing protein [Fimbriimonadaceae bacterium]